MFAEGSIRVGKSDFHYWVKRAEEPTENGIHGGRIIKMTLTKGKEVAYRYDCGLDIGVSDQETETAVLILIKDHN